LDLLFDALQKEGPSFQDHFWNIMTAGIIFPIFEEFKPFDNSSRFENKEERYQWVSSTLIQGLNKFVDLFTKLFPQLRSMLRKLCEVLKNCVLFDNEVISRIGTTCILQLVENNHAKFDTREWQEITILFENLFQETSPTFLFVCYKTSENLYPREKYPFISVPAKSLPDKKEFQSKISVCAAHLLVIQTLIDLLSTGSNYSFFFSIPQEHVLPILECFGKSYQLASAFNANLELRQTLLKNGYMKQLPNLLKQETLSVNAFVSFLFKDYFKSQNSDVADRLIKYSFTYQVYVWKSLKSTTLLMRNQSNETCKPGGQ
jgi:brefeldin A-inhibited guanine nucleotide-exchange protein